MGFLRNCAVCATAVAISAAASGGESFAQIPPAPVIVEAAEATTLAETVEAVGYVHADRAARIRAKTADRIIEIPLQDGASVKKGDVLVQFDDNVEKAQLRFAKQNRQLKQDQLKRMEELSKRGVVAQSKMPEYQQELTQAMVEVEKAEFALEDTKLRAPFDGVLGMYLAEAGDTAAAGDTLTTIFSLTPMQVRLQVPQRKVPSIAVGQKVTVWSAANRDRKHSGRVAFIDPALDPESKAIGIKVVLDDPGELLPGMFVSVSIVVKTIENAVTVPDEALVPTATGFVVFVVKDGKAKTTAVETGLRSGERVQITKGIASGDEVVTEGQLKLRDGASVVKTTLADVSGGGQAGKGAAK